MSNFYNQASWVLVPSGIEEDIVFAQKPISGLGDLSFTRASDATYTDASGVVRRSPYNLFTQSVWTGGGVNVAPTGWTQSNTTGNFEPLPAINGNVLYRFYATSGRRFLQQSINVNAGQEVRLSVFVNSVTTTVAISNVLNLAGFTLANIKYYVNNVEVPNTTEITANTRIVVSFTINSAGSAAFRIGGGAAGTTTYDYVISQPQLVEGTSALDYFPTTDRLNVPRIDFRNADGTLSSCGRLLLEPQRTNSIRNSSMVGAVAGSPGTTPTNWDNASMAGLTRTVVGIGTESGLPYIDLRFAGTATSTTITLWFETVNQIAATTGQTWTNSLYAKLISGSALGYQLTNREQDAGGATLRTGSLTITPTSTLQRFVYTRTNDGTGTAFVRPALWITLTNGAAYDFTIRIAAPQMELGAYATTWVPTTTAAVTRLADTASKTGIGSLIGGTSGTWLIELDTRSTASSGTNAIIGVAGVGKNVGIANTGSNSTFRLNVNGLTDTITQNITTTFKIAISFDATGVVCFVDGQQKTLTNTSAQILSGLTDISFATGARFEYVNIHQSEFYPTRLTNAELAQLTTL